MSVMWPFLSQYEYLIHGKVTRGNCVIDFPRMYVILTRHWHNAKLNVLPMYPPPTCVVTEIEKVSTNVAAGASNCSWWLFDNLHDVVLRVRGSSSTWVCMPKQSL